MNKKTLRIAGWALGLSMAVAGIGAIASTNRVALIETKAAEETITYTFTDKSWSATAGGESANWASGKDGSGFSNSGIQVPGTTTGANGTSPISFSNVSKVVLTYNTNKSAGAGTFDVKVGSNEAESVDWAYSGSSDGRSARFTATINYDEPQTGKVNVKVNTTTNSCYLISCAITFNESPLVSYDHIKFDPSSTHETSYFVGDSFDASGLKVRAYTKEDESDGGTLIDPDFSVSPATFTSASALPQSVTVTASFGTLDDIDVTFDDIIVSEKPKYRIVTDPSDLYVGQSVVIGTTDGTKALGSQNSNNRAAAATETTGSEDTLTITDLGDGVALTLGIIDTYEDDVAGFVYTFNDGDGYLYAPSSSENYLRRQNTIDGNAKFAVTIASRIASITAKGTSTRNKVKYNGTNTIFSCYSSGQSDVSLFACTDELTDKQVVDTFVARYMHMNGSTGEGTGLCKSKGWYTAAATAYEGLSASQKTYFVTNYAGEDNAARRLYWWAKANGHDFNTETGVLAANSVNNPISAATSDNNSPLLIAAIITTGFVATGSVFAIRRHRRDED